MMYRLASLLLLTTVLSAPVLAQSADDERKKQLTETIDLLIDQAIDEGLLKSTDGSGPAQNETTGSAKTAVAVKAKDPSCKATSSIDFSNYQDLRTYADIQLFREEARQAKEERVEPATKAFVGALIALGLHDEALAELDRLAVIDAEIFTSISNLMRGYDGAPIPLIRGLEGCYNKPLWQAIAELVADQESGVEHFTDLLHEYRGLPFQMRSRVTSLIVPALVDFDRSDIAQQALVSFTREEIEISESLTFSKAMIDFGRGDLDAVTTLKSYLDDRTYRSDALLVLSNKTDDDKHAIDSVPVSKLVSIIETTDAEKDVTIALEAALRQLKKKSDYRGIAELAKQPAIVESGRQEEVAAFLGDALMKALASDDISRQLDAFDALLNAAEPLKYYQGHAALYDKAINTANAAGFRSLAQKLAKTAGVKTALKEAELAFSQQSSADVYRIAEVHPSHQGINLIAARQAVIDRKPKALKRFEARMGRSPEAILDLVEQDAVSGAWIVSAAIWKLAGMSKTPETAARIESLMALRATHMAAQKKQGRVALTRANDVLAKTNTWLVSKIREGG
ncbi:MAG: hypothetical protein AAFX02_03090 [Pseudomonadota bacterium]